MHSLTQFKLSLALPSVVLAALWMTFLTRYDRDRARVSAWFALLLISCSGIAALRAFASLDQLSKRSHMDYSFEDGQGACIDGICSSDRRAGALPQSSRSKHTACGNVAFLDLFPFLLTLNRPVEQFL
jgi:hypothetical protein